MERYANSLANICIATAMLFSMTEADAALNSANANPATNAPPQTEERTTRGIQSHHKQFRSANGQPPRSQQRGPARLPATLARRNRSRPHAAGRWYLSVENQHPRLSTGSAPDAPGRHLEGSHSSRTGLWRQWSCTGREQRFYFRDRARREHRPSRNIAALSFPNAAMRPALPCGSDAQ